MSVSAAMIGQLYIPNYHGIAWSQPSGPGTKVLPAQADGPWTAFPVPGQFISEAGESLWRAGCGHGFDTFLIFRDYDSVTSSSAAVCVCPLCTYLIQLIEPYEDATTSVLSWTQHPIIVG